MKHSSFFITLLSFCSLFAQNKTAEQNAIRKVIELETQYYFEGNYDKWASTWAHELTDYVVFTSPDSNGETIGWNNISASYKPGMSNGPLIPASEVAKRYKKYDYQYKINGNLANVIFKEGKGNFITKTLEKQNGEWKITGMTLVYSTDYTFKENYATLKSYAGKWKLVDGSYRTENGQPADSNYKQSSIDYDIRETMYGIEFNSINSYTYSGKFYSSAANEDFIPDNSQNEIKYFDFEKGARGYVTATTGTASFDTTGKFIVKGMYEEKPTQARFENIYSFSPDGLLHHEGRSYDTNGKVTFKWFFALKRI